MDKDKQSQKQQTGGKVKTEKKSSSNKKLDKAFKTLLKSTPKK